MSKAIPLSFLFLLLLFCNCTNEGKFGPVNFLILMSDNQYVSHLGCYGDPVVKTPAIDQLAKDGIRFTNAFCASPSCTPARGAMLSGQDIWRLGEGGNLWSTLDKGIPLFTDLLEESGYHVGHDRKGWGPGNYKVSGRNRNPGGYTFENIEDFIDQNQEDKPWSFWLSSRDPHRPFELGSGIASGMDIEKVVVPPYLPDVPEVRSDICDYYFEIQQFDKEVAAAIALLKEKGQLENTVIILCSDNGWMMPRGLANLYDFGTRVPLIISYPKRFKSNRVVTDFVSLNDLAPTILELANLEVPKVMTAHSLNSILSGSDEGRVESPRSFIVTARERHAICRKAGLGYPSRAIQTDDYLYIRNYEPQRWPAGDPPLFGDIDLHMLQEMTPTKEYMMEHKDDPMVKPLYERAFLKRPAEELFDLRIDRYQMNNVADKKNYQNVKSALEQQLLNYLIERNDARASGKPTQWDTYPYHEEADWIGKPRKEAQEKFGLEAAYSY